MTARRSGRRAARELSGGRDGDGDVDGQSAAASRALRRSVLAMACVLAVISGGIGLAAARAHREAVASERAVLGFCIGTSSTVFEGELLTVRVVDPTGQGRGGTPYSGTASPLVDYSYAVPPGTYEIMVNGLRAFDVTATAGATVGGSTGDGCIAAPPGAPLRSLGV